MKPEAVMEEKSVVFPNKRDKKSRNLKKNKNYRNL